MTDALLLVRSKQVGNVPLLQTLSQLATKSVVMQNTILQILSSVMTEIKQMGTDVVPLALLKLLMNVHRSLMLCLHAN